MPTSYSVGDHFEKFIQRQLRRGRYASASEVVREGLRMLEDHVKLRAKKLDALRAEIQKGAASGVGIAAEQVFDRLTAKYKRREQEHRAP
jgi:antitoxin ParD1/3/4